MKLHFLQVLVLVLLVGCSQSSNNESKAVPESNPTPTPSNEELKAQEELNKKTKELSDVFTRVVQVYPDDSSSLYRFYYETFPAETAEKMQKQIDRISALLDDEIIGKYKEVSKELKPLLSDITLNNSITKSQSERVVYLYSIYDKYRGGSLFNNVLSGDDNYSLVWRTFEIMAAQSELDTCYISSLIFLDIGIRTNAELVQAMQGFIVKAVKNNPNGFLEMYSQRSTDDRDKFSSYAMIWDTPAEELIPVFENISKNSSDAKTRELANELLRKIGGESVNATQNEQFLLKNDQAGYFYRKMKTSDALEIARSNYEVVESTISLEGDSYKTYELNLDGEHLLTLEPSDEEIWRIWVYSEKFRTAKGIGIGSTIKEVLEQYTFDFLQTEGEGSIFLLIEEFEIGFALESTPFDDNWWSNGAKFEDVPDSTRIEFIIP